MTTPTTTVKNLTEMQIRKLHSEAAEAGDYITVAICDLALGGSFNADDYTTLSRAEARKMAAMSRDDAYHHIVECITDAEAARE
jgi:hypothetical protein